ELTCQQQGDPAAHRRPDHNLRTAAKPLEYGKTLLKPAPDGSVAKFAAGFAVTGIVEPHQCAAVRGGPRIERERLGTTHVRIEATQPEKPWGCALTGTYRDPARGIFRADLDEGRLRPAGGGIDHGCRSGSAALHERQGCAPRQARLRAFRALAE